MHKQNFLPTVAVVISALNEQETIGQLLTSIKRQKLSNARLNNITVVSDGSTDKTAKIVKSHCSRLVHLVNHSKRLGKSMRVNQFLDSIDTDIVVLLDADIMIKQINFLELLIKPVVDQKADLTSASLEEFPPQSYVEHVLDVSMQLKRILFQTFKQGNNAYTCFGPARAMSRYLYKDLRFPTNDGEDLFSYLWCMYHGLRFKYVPQAVVCYHVPSLLKDHWKQSARYQKSKELFTQCLPELLVKQELRIPLSVLLKSAVMAIPLCLRQPLPVFIYVNIWLWSLFKSRILINSCAELWLANSSKHAYE